MAERPSPNSICLIALEKRTQKDITGVHGYTWTEAHSGQWQTVQYPRARASGCMLIVRGGGFGGQDFVQCRTMCHGSTTQRLLTELCTQHRRFSFMPEVQPRGSFRCFGNCAIASPTSNFSELDCRAGSLRQKRARLRCSTEVPQVASCGWRPRSPGWRAGQRYYFEK